MSAQPTWTIKGVLKKATDRITTAEIIPMTPRYEEFDLNLIAGEILDAQKLVRVSEKEVEEAGIELDRVTKIAEMALCAAEETRDNRIAERDELEARLVDILVRMGVLELSDNVEDVPTVLVTPPPLPEKVDG